MKIVVRAYERNDLPEMIKIWNDVVEEGIAFPQEELLTMQTGNAFLTRRHTRLLQLMRIQGTSADCIYCIPII